MLEFTDCCSLALLALLNICGVATYIYTFNFIILFHVAAENYFTASFLLHFYTYKPVGCFFWTAVVLYIFYFLISLICHH